MHKTLLQKVMKSCKWLYLAWYKHFDAESVANQFLYLEWFSTNDKDPIHAMQRRLFELVCIWLLDTSEKDKITYYSVTDLWRRVAIDRIHLWYKLVIRDNKDSDVSKWWKKKKTDKKPRSVRAESEARSENKVLNTIIEQQPPIQPTTLLWWIKHLFN